MLRLVRPVSTSFRVLASRSEQLIRQTSRISGLASKSPCHSSILQRPSSIFVARRWITQSSIKPCPSCSEPLPTSLLICPKCSYIHSVPPEQSYHEIFGLTYEPNPYDIDTSALRKKFILLQGVVHPDKWSGKPRDKQEAAAQMSTFVNHVYGTLGDPVKRAFYVLKREGVASPADSEQSLDDPTLITDIMELRESIESAESQDEVDGIRAANTMQMGNLEDEISALVAAKDWMAAKDAAIKLKYFQGIDLAAKVWPNTAHDH